MALLNYPLLVLPGQEDRARNFENEVRQQWDEMLELNRRAGVTRWAVSTQESPMGMLQVHLIEADDMSRVNRDFTDSAHDRWGVAHLRDVAGLDFAKMTQPPPPPVTVFDWRWA
jgi:hypothetical protein